MYSKHRLVARLEGRRDMNWRNGNHERACAYACALADVEDVLNELEAHIIDQKFTMLESAIVRLEKQAFPMLSLRANGYVCGPMQTISDNVKAPAKDGDVGYNLIASEDVLVSTTEVKNIHTGVKVKLPDGYWGLIYARSSTVFKHKILVLGGVIDNGYTGELMISCMALEQQRLVEKGTSIAQLLVFPMVTPILELVDALPKTERGETGFGSTGA